MPSVPRMHVVNKDVVCAMMGTWRRPRKDARLSPEEVGIINIRTVTKVGNEGKEVFIYSCSARRILFEISYY